MGLRPLHPHGNSSVSLPPPFRQWGAFQSLWPALTLAPDTDTA